MDIWHCETEKQCILLLDFTIYEAYVIKAQTLHEKYGQLFFFCLFAFARVAPAEYGGSQAKGLIRAVAAGLHHSHCNSGSKLHLRPTYTTPHGNAGSLTH